MLHGLNKTPVYDQYLAHCQALKKHPTYIVLEKVHENGTWLPNLKIAMKATNSRLDSSGNVRKSGNQDWERLLDFKRKEIRSENSKALKNREAYITRAINSRQEVK